MVQSNPPASLPSDPATAKPLLHTTELRYPGGSRSFTTTSPVVIAVGNIIDIDAGRFIVTKLTHSFTEAVHAVTQVVVVKLSLLPVFPNLGVLTLTEILV